MPATATKPVIVRYLDGSRPWKAMGFLLFSDDRYVVILNDVSTEAALGPLRPIRDHHVEPECKVRIIPRALVQSVERLVEGRPVRFRS